MEFKSPEDLESLLEGLGVNAVIDRCLALYNECCTWSEIPLDEDDAIDSWLLSHGKSSKNVRGGWQDAELEEARRGIASVYEELQELELTFETRRRIVAGWSPPEKIPELGDAWSDLDQAIDLLRQAEADVYKQEYAVIAAHEKFGEVMRRNMDTQSFLENLEEDEDD